MARRRANAGLTHLNAARAPTMVGVGAKAVTHRVAEAEARMVLPTVVARALRATGHRTAKGPVFDTAIVAGVMAAKRTAELIPMCHPLPLSVVDVQAHVRQNGVAIVSRVTTTAVTGVEMNHVGG